MRGLAVVMCMLLLKRTATDGWRGEGSIDWREAGEVANVAGVGTSEFNEILMVGESGILSEEREGSDERFGIVRVANLCEGGFVRGGAREKECSKGFRGTGERPLPMRHRMWGEYHCTSLAVCGFLLLFLEEATLAVVW